MTTTDPTPTACIRCDTPATGLCCSSHKRLLCHLCYRRTHWVEVCVEGCSKCTAEGLPVRVRLADLPAVTDHAPAPTTSTLDLDAIRRRADAATRGPWRADGSEIYTTDLAELAADRAWVGETLDGDDPVRTKANAAFIAAARSDVPALLAEVDRLTAELTTGQVEQLRADLANEKAAHAKTRDNFEAYAEGRIADNEHAEQAHAVLCMRCMPSQLIGAGQLEQHNRGHHADALAEAAQS